MKLKFNFYLLILFFIIFNFFKSNSQNNIDIEKKLIGKKVFGVQFVWDGYGKANITKEGNTLKIVGSQFSKDQVEYCKIEGTLTFDSDKKMTFNGTIQIFTKECCGEINKTGIFTFAKTGKRKYWRLQGFDELCSSTTCAYYLDIFE